MSALDLPSDYPRIKIVHSFAELISTPWGNGINALCWQRTLPGDFHAVVDQLVSRDEATPLDESSLAALPVSEAGRMAVNVLISDLQLLREAGLAPLLDCLYGYPHDDPNEIVPTDVYSFHADSATVPADTYLCSYTEACSEGLRNDQAQRRVDLPKTRAALLQQYGGKDDADFLEYLRENCYDLHYASTPDARPFSFGFGHLWRIAIQYPGNPVPPCIHRAPATIPGRPPRLLLIS